MKKITLLITAIAAMVVTGTFGQSDNQKETSKEISANKKNIRIHSSNRNIEIQSWKEDKVKIVSNLPADDNNPSSDMLEKYGISLNEMSTSINININTNNWGSNGSAKKEIIIYVPQTSKIILDSKYGNVNFKNNFETLELDMTNGNLDAENVNDLKLSSKYGNASFGQIRTGEIDFTNGNFSTSYLGEGEIDSKYSNIELGTVKKLNFFSTNDEYDIDEAGEISARKNYGNLRISKLTSSIDLAGTNTDVKIRNITTSVSTIKFDDKYATLRLPLKSLTDYTVEVKGVYNTVYPNNQNGAASGDTDLVGYTVGSGKTTQVKIKCSNCNIDLK